MDNEKMMFRPKFDEVVAILLTSKNKLRELVGNMKEQGISSENKDSRKQQPFQRAPLFRVIVNRVRGISSLAGQSISNDGTDKTGKNTFLQT